MANVLFAYFAPENVVICESTPSSTHLCCSTEGNGVEMCEDLEGYFAGENGEGVDADELAELFGEEGELREAAHGKDAPEDEFSSGVRRGGEAGPDRVDRFTLLHGKRIQGLLQLDVRAFVSHALMANAEFAGCRRWPGCHRWGLWQDIVRMVFGRHERRIRWCP